MGGRFLMSEVPLYQGASRGGCWRLPLPLLRHASTRRPTQVMRLPPTRPSRAPAASV